MDIELSEIKGIGPARLKALNEAGIRTIRELVMFLPKDYKDLSQTTALADLQAGETATVHVRITGEPTQVRAKKLVITRAFVTDDTEVTPVVWYNQPWLQKQLTEGKQLLLHGKVETQKGYPTLICPTIEQADSIVPVYKPISGIPQKQFLQFMEKALSICEGQWPDELPETLRQKYGLCERNFAMRNAHFPLNFEALKAARKRIAFEELLLYQVALSELRGGAKKGIAMTFPQDTTDRFWKSMPFPPTNAQRRVLEEVSTDLRSERAMARMVQGDVGCGKTVIAFGAILLAHESGWQSALMAPTEVLARQHYDAAKAMLEPLGCSVGQLTGSLTAKQHREVHEAIREGKYDVIIGTHALITEKVEYKNLGLVITDEQHRFGVRQRTMLSEKGEATNVLVMSATPIPRTLSLILYGDLELSIVDELPPGRTPVATRVVPDAKREGMYGFLREEIKKGRQAYFVCPLVEESEAVDALPAEKVFESLKSGPFKDMNLELVHGRMKPAEKDAALERFRTGEANILVSTTVIEVGVNVPNATVMVIENAERFGLAQLHQLRGRVGRGKYESWCFLMSNPNQRLRFLTSTNDGFKIAQKDMELRGPGELFGTRQSGPLAAGLSALATDTELLKLTHDEAILLTHNPDSQEARQVIKLARERFAGANEEFAVN